ncbi:hypothetical protein ACOIV7_004600 [Vibrio parahaemolyticus]|nr:hypothetical protein [Vibrio parahaemolyticus]HAS6903106.1 hypothetical protein [Vibrio parahaemolyticus]
MGKNYYKTQIIKNSLDCVNYLLLSVLVYYFCFTIESEQNITILSQLLALYKSWQVWVWFEVIVFLGLISLSFISASIVKVNWQLLKVEQKLSDSSDNLNKEGNSKELFWAVLLALFLCVVSYFGVSTYWGV